MVLLHCIATNLHKHGRAEQAEIIIMIPLCYLSKLHYFVTVRSFEDAMGAMYVSLYPVLSRLSRLLIVCSSHKTS